MKKLILILSLLFCSFTVNIYAEEKDDKLIYENESASTYYDFSQDMVYSDVDLSNINEGDIIVLYEDEIGSKVTVTVLSSEKTSSTNSTGMSNWSGGNIPAGRHILKVEKTDFSLFGQSYIARYNITVNCYPVNIIDISNPYVNAFALNSASISTPSLSIIRSSPTSSLLARTSMSWIATKYYDDGSIHSSTSCYLNCEINSSGYLRICWGY